MHSALRAYELRSVSAINNASSHHSRLRNGNYCDRRAVYARNRLFPSRLRAMSFWRREHAFGYRAECCSIVYTLLSWIFISQWCGKFVLLWGRREEVLGGTRSYAFKGSRIKLLWVCWFSLGSALPCWLVCWISVRIPNTSIDVYLLNFWGKI